MFLPWIRVLYGIGSPQKKYPTTVSSAWDEGVVGTLLAFLGMRLLEKIKKIR